MLESIEHPAPNKSLQLTFGFMNDNLNALQLTMLAILVSVFQYSFAGKYDPECPDYSFEGGIELTAPEFREYLKDPDVIAFRLSDAFICYRLKLYARPWGPEGQCPMGGSTSIPFDALESGIGYGQVQFTIHRSRCEYVKQVGPIPNDVNP